MAGCNEAEECEGVGLGGRMDRAVVFRAAGMFAMMGGKQLLPRSSSRKREDE